MAGGTELATFGGGCFWCVETVFSELRGVESVISGYAGGNVPNPNYEDVCSGSTGRAEVVQIKYDPKVISYRQLLQIFFTVHDPTTKDRQGADIGDQYRSVIFYHDAEQKKVAEIVIKETADAGIWPNPIVTELKPLTKFYKAEDYHQEYYKRNPNAGYCSVVIAPKVMKFRAKYFKLLKK
jgi:peptide-methionine (S)-S-oxide reductase